MSSGQQQFFIQMNNHQNRLIPLYNIEPISEAQSRDEFSFNTEVISSMQMNYSHSKLDKRKGQSQIAGGPSSIHQQSNSQIPLQNGGSAIELLKLMHNSIEISQRMAGSQKQAPTTITIVPLNNPDERENNNDVSVSLTNSLENPPSGFGLQPSIEHISQKPSSTSDGTCAVGPGTGGGTGGKPQTIIFTPMTSNNNNNLTTWNDDEETVIFGNNVGRQDQKKSTFSRITAALPNSNDDSEGEEQLLPYCNSCQQYVQPITNTKPWHCDKFLHRLFVSCFTCECNRTQNLHDPSTALQLQCPFCLSRNSIQNRFYSNSNINIQNNNFKTSQNNLPS